MDFVLLHNGKNIRDSISLSKCYSCDRYGGMLDDLTIEFSTESHSIAFNENDELEINADGFTTGAMSLDSCIGNNGRFTIKALSCRHENKKKKSKIWRSVTLSKIISDVAKNTNLKPLLYGIKDFSYLSVSQVMETDLQFLARICKREGYSIKCDNGNLIVFNELYLENNSKPIELSKSDVDSDYSFDRSTDGLASMTVQYFDTESLKNISFTATDKEMRGGEGSKIEFVSSINEAKRFATGYLREANKFSLRGFLEMPYNKNISAGTVADLSGFEEFDARYVVYEAKHDFIAEKTAIKVRKILNY